MEINGRGAAPVITSIHTGGLSWLKLEKDVREPGEIAKVKQQIEELERPDSCLAQVVLSGLVRAEDGEVLSHLHDLINARLLWGTIDTSGLRAVPDDSSWLSKLPAGVIHRAAQRLQQKAENDETAAQALLELYALAEGEEK